MALHFHKIFPVLESNQLEVLCRLATKLTASIDSPLTAKAMFKGSHVNA